MAYPVRDLAEEQEQLKLEMEMAEAEAENSIPAPAPKSTNMRTVLSPAAQQAAEKYGFQGALKHDYSYPEKLGMLTTTKIRSGAQALPILGPMIPRALEAADKFLGYHGLPQEDTDWQKTYDQAAADEPETALAVGLLAPNPLGFAGKVGRIGGGMLDAAERGYNSGGLKEAGIAATATGALQGTLETAIPLAGKLAFKSIPSMNRGGNSVLAKFLGLSPDELSRMAPEDVDEMMLALGLPKVENNKVTRPPVIEKWASRQDALNSVTGLSDELGEAKGQVIQSLPPVDSNDVAGSFRMHADDPMMTGAEAQFGRPRLNEMADRYENMGNFNPPTQASPIVGGPPASPGYFSSNPVPMSMLSKEGSELGNQVFSGANPSALDKAQNIGMLRAKGAVDEIVNTTAAGAGRLPDLQSANKGFAGASTVRESLLKTMNPATEGQTAGFMNKMTDLAARGFTAVGGQRLMSTAGLGAKEIASDLLYRLPNSKMQTPDMSRVARILQIIKDSDQPEVDFEVASQDPEFTRAINEARKDNVGN